MEEVKTQEKKKPSVRANFVMNMIYTVSGMIFPLITYPYAARILTETGVGAVAFANSVVTFFGIFSQLGIPMYGVRACAEVSDDKEELTRTVTEILMINAVTLLFTYAAFLAAVLVYPKFREEKTLFLVMGSLLFFNMIGVEWMYRGLEEYRYITVRTLAFKAVGAAGIFLLIRSEKDYVIYGGLTIFALAGSFVMNFLNLRRYLIIGNVGHYNPRRHLRMISVFWGMSVATTIYTNMDSAMLGIMSGKSETGFYDAAVKIKNILVGVISSLGTVMLPRMSFYVSRGAGNEFERMTSKAFRFNSLFSFPLCVYFACYAPEVVRVVGGVRFGRSVLPMRIIMPTLILIALSNVTGLQILVPLKREREVLLSEIAGAAVNLVVNLTLIPKFGAAGAAVGTLAAEAVVLGTQVCFMKGRAAELFAGVPYLKMIPALAAAVPASLCVRGLAGEHTFTIIILSGMIFFAVYALVLLLMKEELACEARDIAAGFIRRR